MPNYKAVDIDTLEAGLTAIADLIREKTGISEELDFPNGFIAALQTITSVND